MADDDADTGRPWLAWATVALSGGLAALTVTAMFLMLRVREYDADDDHRAVVVEAATERVVDFTTYDYEHFDDDVSRVLSGATGTFREEYEANAEEVGKLVTENKSVSEGKVVEVGIIEIDSDSATVLVAADVTVTNTAVPEGEVRPTNLQLDLRYERGTWRTADLKYVG